ncbi:mRNA-binding ribosome synthesis protein nop7 [Ceratocystis pirilliformis]|uniref:Pescadillo homolog n=1 Tax=Ceratocystis pirilliformis TaxID=259994 RepID=A0ABR3ZH29_9PEZI
MPPRIKKKGKAGAAKNYITRNQALKKLQLSLADFRKLCIWKGIFPREPRNRKKANKSSTYSTTFYYAKDIQYLLHEPLIQKFRDLKALEKKISKALGRGDVGDAKRLNENASRSESTGKARFTLDHVIRERYPTFNDALRDLDDCLSMLFLFANLPSTNSVPAKVIARCERLCLEFQHYCITSHSLRKSFLSIKGIYYQANINGEDILWLVPYKFNQRVTADVDYRIMGTFVEFYITLLTFVNFRLYTKQGLRYPPKFDQNKDNESAELGAFTLEGRGIVEESIPKQIAEPAAGHKVDPKTQAAVNNVVKALKSSSSGEETSAPANTEATENSNSIDKFEPVVAGGDVLPQPSYSSSDPSTLFANMTFYLSRETPRQPIEFILRAFGCKRIGWDSVLGDGAFTTNENDPSITHQIVDRPPIQVRAEKDADTENVEDNQTAQKLGVNGRVPGRVYVQPQWVWDCINDEEVKSPDLYAPGAQLPPHLSPFVKPEAGRYDPTIPLADQQPEAEALESDEEEAEAEGSAMDEDETTFNDFSANEEEDEDEDEDEDEVTDDERQMELEAELRGENVHSKAKASATPREKARQQARKEFARKAKEEAEDKERAMGMMSKKKRKLYEQMVYTNTKKSTEDQKLRSKRRKMEKEQQKKKTKA